MSCTEWESELNCPYAMSYTQIHTLIQQIHNSVIDPHSVSEGKENEKRGRFFSPGKLRNKRAQESMVYQHFIQ